MGQSNELFYAQIRRPYQLVDEDEGYLHKITDRPVTEASIMAPCLTRTPCWMSCLLIYSKNTSQVPDGVKTFLKRHTTLWSGMLSSICNSQNLIGERVIELIFYGMITQVIPRVCRSVILKRIKEGYAFLPTLLCPSVEYFLRFCRWIAGRC